MKKVYPENRRPNVKCVLCGTPMYRKPRILAKGAGRYCSRACRNKAHPPKNHRPPTMRGAANPAWKGGVTQFKKKGNYTGVIYVRAPEWALPMARKDGYVMQHRLVMAQTCGFLLTRNEVVDHLDHNPSNNHPSNLALYPSNGDHKRGEVGRFAEGVANRWSLKVLAPL
jgi:hypothetical protein